MSFSVFFNTLYAVDITNSKAIRDFNIDWSRFEEGDYELSYSFESEFQEADQATVSTMPHALSLPDLPLKNVMCPIQGRSQSSPAVGLIQSRLYKGPETIDVQYSGSPTNKPVICNRPSSQNFRVRFLGREGNELTNFVDYTLMLYFKKI